MISSQKDVHFLVRVYIPFFKFFQKFRNCLRGGGCDTTEEELRKELDDCTIEPVIGGGQSRGGDSQSELEEESSQYGTEEEEVSM